MRVLDRTFAILLFLGGVGHSLGSVKAFHDNPITLLWALCASGFVFLLAAVNLLRAGRPGDVALSWICLVAGVAWIGASLEFGVLIHHVTDPRPMIFGVITLVLCGFSVRTMRAA